MNENTRIYGSTEIVREGPFLKELSTFSSIYFCVFGVVSISVVHLFAFGSCWWVYRWIEFGLGVSLEESWVSLIGVIKVPSSKVRSMLWFRVEGAQTMVQLLALRGDWTHELLYLDESWVSQIGVIKVLSSKVKSMLPMCFFRYHCGGRCIVLRSWKINGDVYQ